MGQIDAPINPGNSGGPVIQNELVIGVAEATQMDAQNISYFVPSCYIKHVLDDLNLHEQKNLGVPSTLVWCDTLENKTLRRYLGIDNNQMSNGILIYHINPNYVNDIDIKVFDILLKIENYDVDSDGCIELRKHERVYMTHLFSMKQIGESLNVTILRNSKIHNLQLPMVSSLNDCLIPMSGFGHKQIYKIYGGLVITYLTDEFIRNQEGSDRYTDYPGFPEYPNEQHVFITQILEHEINKGYDIYKPEQLISINNNPIHNMNDVEIQLKLSENLEFIRFVLKNKRIIVLDVQEVKLKEHEIFEQHRAGTAVPCNPADTIIL